MSGSTGGGPHWQNNVGVAGLRLQCIGPGAVVLTGDSRMESCTWGTLGGHPAVQAGFAGAYLRDILPLAPAACANLQAGAVIIHIGANNLYLPPDDPQNVGFIADLATLVGNIHTTTRRIILTTIIPTEKGFSEPDVSVQTRGAFAANLSSQIIAAAATWSLPCVDLNGLFRQADLTAIAGMTHDGIHFSSAGWTAIRPFVDASAAQVFTF